jgi:hypothetical protein
MHILKAVMGAVFVPFGFAKAVETLRELLEVLVGQ